MDMPLGSTPDTGFEPVREAFVEVLRSQPGTGASVAAWYDGRWVLDLLTERGLLDVDTPVHTRWRSTTGS